MSPFQPPIGDLTELITICDKLPGFVIYSPALPFGHLRSKALLCSQVY